MVAAHLGGEGIRFYPTRIANQQVWKIEGGVNYRHLVEGDGMPVFTLDSDPKGT
jgi:hypothetical protein